MSADPKLVEHAIHEEEKKAKEMEKKLESYLIETGVRIRKTINVHWKGAWSSMYHFTEVHCIWFSVGMFMNNSKYCFNQRKQNNNYKTNERGFF